MPQPKPLTPTQERVVRPGVPSYGEDDCALDKARDGLAGVVLREHWKRRDWEPANYDSYYVSWGFILRCAWELVRCNILGHQWHDTHFALYGEPGDWRACDRCYRCESMPEAWRDG